MTTPLPEPGSRLRDRYDIVRILKSGGMGAVFEATNGFMRLAVKFPTIDLIDRELVDRFKREARVLRQIDSPNVVRVIEMDETEEGLPFIVMEYLEGRDLAAELAARGPLPVDEACRWMIQACKGVSAAHAKGIVHRDLKPGNLFLSDGAPERVLKVLDFGISKLAVGDGTARTSTGDTLGTPGYMSPEQLLSSSSVDGRADVWALGVVLYRLLTNTLPFQGSSPVALALAITTQAPQPIARHRSGVPVELDVVISKALSKEIDGRFPSVDALSEALLPFALGQVVSSPSRPQPGLIVIESAPATPPAQARTQWLLAALVVALLGLVVTLVWLRPSTTQAPLVVSDDHRTGGAAAARRAPFVGVPVTRANGDEGATATPEARTRTATAPPFNPLACFARVGYWTSNGARNPSSLHAAALEGLATDCYRASLTKLGFAWNGEFAVSLWFTYAGQFRGPRVPDAPPPNLARCIWASAVGTVDDVLPRGSPDTIFTATITFTCPP